MPQITVHLHPKLPPLQAQDTVVKMLTLFSRYCITQLGLTGSIYVELLPATGHEHNLTTGGYVPASGRVYSRAEGRALIDIMRTVAHELVHQRQDELGELQGQNHPDIGGRVENEANAVAGMLIKQFVLDTNCRWIHSI